MYQERILEKKTNDIIYDALEAQEKQKVDQIHKTMFTFEYGGMGKDYWEDMLQKEESFHDQKTVNKR